MVGQFSHRLVDEHGLGFGVADDVGDFVRGEVSVHRTVVQPRKLAAPGDLEELRTVRQYQRDAIARPKPGLVQRGGHPSAVRIQLAVGDHLALRHDQRRRIRGAGRVVGDVHRGTAT
jgi:hypothetical protein